jgi:hypothetical protein
MTSIARCLPDLCMRLARVAVAIARAYFEAPLDPEPAQIA